MVDVILVVGAQQQLEFQPPARDRRRSAAFRAISSPMAASSMRSGSPAMRHGRRNRRRFGAGGTGRGRDRGAAPHRAGRSLTTLPGVEEKITSACRRACSKPPMRMKRSRNQQRSRCGNSTRSSLGESAPMCSASILRGRKRYPLVLMLEPLFRCNLACAGCGKIDYPDKILNQRLSVADAWARSTNAARRSSCSPAASRCCTGSCPRSSRARSAGANIVTVCTNALLLEKKLDLYRPHAGFNWSIHLDGDKEMHDRSVCQNGVYDRAVAAIKAAKAARLPRQHQLHAVQRRRARARRRLLRQTSRRSASTASRFRRATPMSARPTSSISSIAARTKQLFRDIFRRGQRQKRWPFFQSALFLDFLAGNQTYHCTPWGNPTRTVFGWQRPCYLLGEGYAKTFKELMEDTDWDPYGTGNYEKCADCMVHSGFEATRRHGRGQKPWKVATVALAGVKTDGPDGAGHPARPAAPGRIRLLAPRRAEASRDQRSRDPRRAGGGSGIGAPWRGAYRRRGGAGPGAVPAAEQRGEHRSNIDPAVARACRQAPRAAVCARRDRRPRAAPRRAAHAAWRAAPRCGFPCRPRPRRSPRAAPALPPAMSAGDRRRRWSTELAPPIADLACGRSKPGRRHRPHRRGSPCRRRDTFRVQARRQTRGNAEADDGLAALGKRAAR